MNPILHALDPPLKASLPHKTNQLLPLSIASFWPLTISMLAADRSVLKLLIIFIVILCKFDYNSDQRHERLLKYVKKTCAGLTWSKVS